MSTAPLDLNLALPPGRLNLRVGLWLERGDALLLQREHSDPFWTVPGGRLRLGETLEQGLRREMREELGLELGPLRLCGLVENFYAWKGQAVHEWLWLMKDSCPGAAELQSREPQLEFSWWPLNELPDLRPLALKEWRGKTDFLHAVQGHDTT
ncbi:NUDIX hydrolase [Inhella sp.]|uniref:NUDIX hydrolase n=1 Tax=Inhella sp. TaxID=1921806 RepID=UPI0035AF9DFC